MNKSVFSSFFIIWFPCMSWSLVGIFQHESLMVCYFRSITVIVNVQCDREFVSKIYFADFFYIIPSNNLND